MTGGHDDPMRAAIEEMCTGTNLLCGDIHLDTDRGRGVIGRCPVCGGYVRVTQQGDAEWHRRPR